MKSVIFGKVTKTMYELNDGKSAEYHNGNVVDIEFVCKPHIVTTEEVVDYKEICNFEGHPTYNRNYNFRNRREGFNFPIYIAHSLNISENEEVAIDREVFRADLNELHIFTSHISENEDIGKEETEELLKSALMEFNVAIINSDDKLKNYCKLLKLDISKVDFDELFQVVYPDSVYEIKNNTLRIIPNDPMHPFKDKSFKEDLNSLYGAGFFTHERL